MFSSNNSYIEELVEENKRLKEKLERLTQPVGEVEPVAWAHSHPGGGTCAGVIKDKYPSQYRDYSQPLYSAETVARLQAERDELDRLHTNQMHTILALQEQVKVLRDAVESCYEDSYGYYFNTAKVLKAKEALAATEPKEKAE